MVCLRGAGARHNELRAQHSTPPLLWDDSLAHGAQVRRPCPASLGVERLCRWLLLILLKCVGKP